MGSAWLQLRPQAYRPGPKGAQPQSKFTGGPVPWPVQPAPARPPTQTRAQTASPSKAQPARLDHARKASFRLAFRLLRRLLAPPKRGLAPLRVHHRQRQRLKRLRVAQEKRGRARAISVQLPRGAGNACRHRTCAEPADTDTGGVMPGRLTSGRPRSGQARTCTRCSSAPGPPLMPPLWTVLSRDQVPRVASALRHLSRASLAGRWMAGDRALCCMRSGGWQTGNKASGSATRDLGNTSAWRKQRASGLPTSAACTPPPPPRPPREPPPEPACAPPQLRTTTRAAGPLPSPS